MSPIFITGGTGYIGRRLIKKLVSRGYDVTALVRQGSESKLPKGVRAIIADPFNASTFQNWIPKGATFIQLLGLSHPSPRNGEQFNEIDLRSVKASADAAAAGGVEHFVYVSVSMAETTVMKTYQQARRHGEAYVLTKGFRCTFIRPWYVLGPGRWWPALLLPFYAVANLNPRWRKTVEGKTLVTVGRMIDTLLRAVESPPMRQRIFEISHIRQGNIPTI
jgi:uncharacterized protein YbjT (DUF2867 family)